MTPVTAVGVLGPVLLVGPDGPIRLGSARQRRLLVALVAHLGAAVGTDVLAELVWDTPPADPAGAVQTNVARLRRVLPPSIRIATTPEGYELLAERPDVDVTAFTDHLVAATADPPTRLRRLDAALRLWRGRPYAELDHLSVRPEVARLTELRAGAVEQHATALLAAGRAGEAIAALDALTVAEPLREGAVALLVRALAGVGRQGDALAAYSRLRTRLADELGLDPAPELRALEQQVLRQEVPEPVLAPEQRPAPVPALPVSSFVGRDTELAVARDLLDRSRVVTLCGPGGVGKTRLALHVAADVADRYDDGVLLVELGDGGPADVEPAMAVALRLSDGGAAGTDSFATRIVEVLAVRRQLLVLDNCEHVADEVAPLVEAVIAGAPAVDVLLTSREPMRVDGEHVLGVEPLGPAAAAQLLSDRMRAGGGPTAGPGPDEAELVAALCSRLDGLPLALELAAARALPLGLPGLLTAVDGAGDGAFDVLRGGRRTSSARHRSLRDVVAWSYELLDDEQRTLFDRLSVFAGPVEHSAVVAVCGGAEALPDLVDRSLVVRHTGEPARFGMLETLRAFGRSRLATAPAGAQLRARHAAWAVRLAGEVTAARRGPTEATAVARFDAHLADLRRAHAWLRATGPLEDLLQLTMLFAEFAYLRGRIDLVRMVEETLQAAGALGPASAGDRPSAHPLVPRLLGLLATSGWQRGDLDMAEAQATRAVAMAEAGDPVTARDGYEALANVASFRGDLDGALRLAERARDLAMGAGDVELEYQALVDLVIVSAYAGDDAAAGRYESELADRVGRIDSPTARAFLAYARGERRAESGAPGAAGYLEDSVRTAESVDSSFVAGIARHTLLTSAARRSGEPAATLSSLRPLIDHWHRFGAWTHLWVAVRAVIETLSRLGRHGDATLLLGALRASPTATRAFGADAGREAAVESAARPALGPAFETLRAEGAALGDAGAVALVRRLTAPTGSAQEIGQDVLRGDLPLGRAVEHHGQDERVVLPAGQGQREHRSEQAERGPVLRQDAGREPADPRGRGPLGERFDQPPADAAPVPGVDHRDGDLGRGAAVLRDPDAAGEPDGSPVVGLGDQGDVVALVDVEQGAAQPGGEPGKRGVEAQVAAARRQARDELVEQGGLVPAQGADAESGAGGGGHDDLLSGPSSAAGEEAPALRRKRPSPPAGAVAGTGQTVRFTRHDGRDVAWSAFGHGPPLVIGGWWMSHLELDWRNDAFRGLVGLLAARATVVRYDRPGTGLSDRSAPPSVALDDEVAVLAGVVDAVTAELGPGPVALLGASSGGPVAAAYTAQNAERVSRLVLYGSYAVGHRVADVDVRDALVAMVSGHWGLGSRVLADVFLPGAGPAERDAFARFQRDSAPADTAARSLAAVYGFDVRSDLPRISRPTLVLHRRGDRAIRSALGRELAAMVPGAVFAELDGDEHFPWRGDAGAVARAVLEFLAPDDTPVGPPDDGIDPVPAGQLSARELEVLRLVAVGMADREIARRLVLSPHTVHRHLANVRAKLGLPSRSAAAAYAVRSGLI